MSTSASTISRHRRGGRQGSSASAATAGSSVPKYRRAARALPRTTACLAARRGGRFSTLASAPAFGASRRSRAKPR
eukprot:22915-Pelagococcus_subviridis.AAC.1